MVRFFDGYLSVFAEGKEVERFFNLCIRRDIELWDIARQDKGYILKMNAEDFFQVKDICKKTGCRLKILKRQGAPFWWKKQKQHRLFLAGPFFCILLLWMLSGCLWSVEIEGNYQLSRDILMDFLQEQGVHYGMPLQNIPITEIKTGLREDYEEINWVSVSVEGTVLKIRMKENDVWSQEREELPGLNLISTVDGTIDDILIREGVALVKKGDEVKKGDVLIEGKIPIPDENGEIKRIEYCQADGDIWIRTEIPIEESLILSHVEKEYSGEEKETLFLEVGGHKLGLDIGKIPYEEYDILEERKAISLLGEIQLPFTVCRRIYREYTSVNTSYSREEGEKILEERLSKIIEALEKKGVQIIEKNVKIVANSVSLSLDGSITILQLHNQQSAAEAE